LIELNWVVPDNAFPKNGLCQQDVSDRSLFPLDNVNDCHVAVEVKQEMNRLIAITFIIDI